MFWLPKEVFEFWGEKESDKFFKASEMAAIWKMFTQPSAAPHFSFRLQSEFSQIWFRQMFSREFGVSSASRPLLRLLQKPLKIRIIEVLN